jgi:hypothetical protein
LSGRPERCLEQWTVGDMLGVRTGTFICPLSRPYPKHPNGYSGVQAGHLGTFRGVKPLKYLGVACVPYDASNAIVACFAWAARIAMNLTQLTLLIVLGSLFVILLQLLAFWLLG